MSNPFDVAALKGFGQGGDFSSALPTQTLLESQKNDAWIKLCMDRLETIAVRQYNRNIEFNDYYSMVRGNLIYSDYGLEDFSKEIIRLRGETDYPVHAKHYDFLGIICNQIESDWITSKAAFRIDNTDPVSQNDFTRDQDSKLWEYTQKNFNLELEHKLLARGIVINEDRQFQSEEEMQAYAQELQQQKDQLVPPEAIQEAMFKNWKTTATEWAEKTYELDQDRFGMEKMSRQEIVDRILTGRWFRHYHIGYDYYKPERWHPCQVSFSEDLDIEYPQDAEYVSFLTQMSPSKFLNRFGDKIDEDTQKRLMGYYNQNQSGGASVNQVIQNNFGQVQQLPFAGFHDYELGLQFQETFGVPMGESTVVVDGQQKVVPSWYSPLARGGGFLSQNTMSELRSDIDLRSDTLQVTESYWRSYKRVGILNYINEDGYMDQVFTTDDLLPEFLKENEITTLRKISLEEAELRMEPNTIAYTWIPEIRWGVKAKSHNSYLTQDLYIGGKALPFQIKGTMDGGSNIYDAKIPVAGYIGDSIAKKLRPYIIKHNIVLNQIYSLLEKELGTFFLFDIKYLPSEYKGSGNTRQALEQMYDLIQDIGIVPVDTSRQNLEGGQPAMNAFATQSIDYTGMINNRMNLAVQFKLQALEQIGITPQRIGTPDQYSTAEGIKQGNTASYAQTEGLFAVQAEADKRACLLHLTVAQYCQKNNKDYSFLYTKSDGEKAFIELADPMFQAREFGIKLATDSNSKKTLETLRAALLQNNTAGADILDMAEIVTSNSMTSIMAHARQNRIDNQKRIEQQQAHEQELADKQIQAADKALQLKYDQETKIQNSKNETDLEVKKLDTYGKMSINQNADSSLYDRLDRATELALNDIHQANDFSLKERNLDIKEEEMNARKERDDKEFQYKLDQLSAKKRQTEVQLQTSLINKN
jgi:hypothetical protein|nr:MAG TPA: portal protein [Caudoviricetes sp.]